MGKIGHLGVHGFAPRELLEFKHLRPRASIIIQHTTFALEIVNHRKSTILRSKQNLHFEENIGFKASNLFKTVSNMSTKTVDMF